MWAQKEESKEFSNEISKKMELKSPDLKNSKIPIFNVIENTPDLIDNTKKKKSSMDDKISEKFEDIQEILLPIQFHIKAFDLPFGDDSENQVWATEVNFQRKPLDFEMNCQIESLLIIDNVVIRISKIGL